LRLNEHLAKLQNYQVEGVVGTDPGILRLGHSDELLNSYKTGVPKQLAESSGIQSQEDYSVWLMNVAWAHIKVAESALRGAPAVILGNGGHHAEYESGYGFGPINSLIITSKYMIQNSGIEKIAVLDLDVHYANGTHSLGKYNPSILPTDIYRNKLEKWQYTKNQENILHRQIENSDHYFEALEIILQKITGFNPDFIFYYLGMDVIETDRMGGIKGFDERALDKRDDLVAEFLNLHHYPTAISLGGGYINHAVNDDAVEAQYEAMVERFAMRILKLSPTGRIIRPNSTLSQLTTRT
jgi:acetoin utilization deacetylase AcuC-like enzyme